MQHLHYLLFMIFLHICDDYYLQGWLASAKQKSWWEKNSPQPLYKQDYIMALAMHSFSWTFMIMLPVLFHLGFQVNGEYLVIFLVNMGIHMFVDNAKANLKMLNLVQDQAIHLLQIAWTYILMF